ncbi:PRD domain-containing protein [Anaeropeptidivorans aminofermentans]|uniref:PRD domain-containing protein n=1 Tax=Anaeropeptidivorans aminofermentans TaxID=2934315 RepID=UPI0020258B7E|nr:PRD domain-containing protein [Anaeropeptidivorans aminofermentans]
MKRFDYKEICKVIDERTKEWNIEKEEIQALEKKLTDIMNFCEKEGVVFDSVAGPVFVTHLITLYNRLKKGEFVDMDMSFADEISTEALELAKKIASHLEGQYGRKIPDNEEALIATHIGAMQLRLKEEKGEEL